MNTKARKALKSFRKKLSKSIKKLSPHTQQVIISWPLIVVSVLVVIFFVIIMSSLGRSHTRYSEMMIMHSNLSSEIDIIVRNQDMLIRQLSFIEMSSQSEFETLRLQTEESLLEARDELESARLSLEDRIVNQSAQLRNVARTWSQRVPLIQCTFGRQETTGLTSFSNIRGAGTLFNIDGQITLLTNRHILEEQDRVLETCTVRFGDSDEVYTFNASSISNLLNEGMDFGSIVLGEDRPQIFSQRSARERTICTEPASIGDQIVILGYPSIGAENSITVTEGIISGYENDFYITSAKVEKGNSGGAAVLVRENCYLGIPTFTASGRAESLARILDVRVVY